METVQEERIYHLKGDDIIKFCYRSRMTKNQLIYFDGTIKEFYQLSNITNIIISKKYSDPIFNEAPGELPVCGGEVYDLVILDIPETFTKLKRLVVSGSMQRGEFGGIPLQVHIPNNIKIHNLRLRFNENQNFENTMKLICPKNIRRMELTIVESKLNILDMDLSLFENLIELVIIGQYFSNIRIRITGNLSNLKYFHCDNIIENGIPDTANNLEIIRCSNKKISYKCPSFMPNLKQMICPLNMYNNLNENIKLNRNTIFILCDTKRIINNPTYYKVLSLFELSYNAYLKYDPDILFDKNKNENRHIIRNIINHFQPELKLCCNCHKYVYESSLYIHNIFDIWIVYQKSCCFKK